MPISKHGDTYSRHLVSMWMMPLRLNMLILLILTKTYAKDWSSYTRWKHLYIKWTRHLEAEMKAKYNLLVHLAMHSAELHQLLRTEGRTSQTQSINKLWFTEASSFQEILFKIYMIWKKKENIFSWEDTRVHP